MNLQPSYISNSEYRDIKRFFAKFLLFALLVFSVDKVFAYWATQAVLNDTNRFASVLYRGEVDSKIVCFGSSKTHTNINAALIEEKSGISCYNLAIDSASVEMCEFLFEELLLHNKKPEIVFIEADFAQLDAHFMKFRNELLASFCNASSHTSHRIDPTLVGQVAFWFFRCKNSSSGGGTGDLLRTMLRYARNICEGNVSQNQNNADHGTNRLPPLKRDQLKESWRNDTRWKVAQISPSRQETYRRIVELAKSEGITLVLYGPPFLGKNLDKDYAQKIDHFFTQLEEQNEHVHYWSFREDAQLRSDITLWNDPIHMNRNGAAALSQKIVNKLNILQSDKPE